MAHDVPAWQHVRHKLTAAQEAAYAKSKARPVIAACLHRDPRRRPTAARLLTLIDSLGLSATPDASRGLLPL